MLQLLAGTCSEATPPDVSLLPVICHRGEVQALGREAHGSQGADVHITVLHWGVKLGVAVEKERGRSAWGDGYSPPSVLTQVLGL